MQLSLPLLLVLSKRPGEENDLLQCEIVRYFQTFDELMERPLEKELSLFIPLQLNLLSWVSIRSIRTSDFGAQGLKVSASL